MSCLAARSVVTMAKAHEPKTSASGCGDAALISPKFLEMLMHCD